MTAYAPAMERTQDKVIKRQPKQRRDWAKWGLAAYFIVFLAFLYAPMILMAILSFQGYYGGVTFPFKGPAGFNWWRSIFQEQVGNIYTNAGRSGPPASAPSTSAWRRARSSRSWPSPSRWPSAAASGATASPST
jgi:ABC-type sugar transport system permease subunit